MSRLVTRSVNASYLPKPDDIKQAVSKDLSTMDADTAMKFLTTPFHKIAENIAIGSYESEKYPEAFSNKDLLIVRVTHQETKGVYEIPNYPTRWIKDAKYPTIKWTDYYRDEQHVWIWDIGQDL